MSALWIQEIHLFREGPGRVRALGVDAGGTWAGALIGEWSAIRAILAPYAHPWILPEELPALPDVGALTGGVVIARNWRSDPAFSNR